MRWSRFLFITALLLSIEAMAQQGTADCATPAKPSWEHSLRNKITELKKTGQKKKVVNTIPFQIHLVVRTDSVSAVSLQDIYNEIDSANYFYANAGLEFYECLAPEIIYDDSLFDYDYSEENILLTQHYTNDVINIYVANSVSYSGSTVCGYTNYPPSPDFIVVSSLCAKNGSTTAHELGHYFGLLHTHGGSSDELVDGSNCGWEGDLVCDTPADPTLSTSVVDAGCNYTGSAVDANNMPYAPDVNNIMSYSRKICRNAFSTDQYSIIASTYISDRSNLACVTAGLASEDKTRAVSVFPNPGNTSVNFILPGNGGFTWISLFNSIGQPVLRAKVAGNNLRLETGMLPPGIYFFVAEAGEKIFHGKWIKEQ